MTKLNILAIEDDPVVLRIYDEFLSKAGHRLIIASSGQDAVKELESEQFDLICLDLKLPDMDGTLLLKKIQHKIEWTPVVIITANPTLESSIEAVNAGIVTEYAVKPVDTKSLILIVEKAVEKAKLAIENKRLVKKLEVANKALRERVSELEQFSKFAMDAKQKIAQLENQIQELQKKPKKF